MLQLKPLTVNLVFFLKKNSLLVSFNLRINMIIKLCAEFELVNKNCMYLAIKDVQLIYFTILFD